MMRTENASCQNSSSQVGDYRPPPVHKAEARQRVADAIAESSK